ncbi:MAG: hypothetical protein KDD42_03535 [Bdellovibrionales bacterium]|nr:hypothetical protein [Bdellovibrionales bacterium]
MAESEGSSRLKALSVDCRVRRKDRPGCGGVVKDIRAETTSKASEISDEALMVLVLWDNGISSYFTPESLEVL